MSDFGTEWYDWVLGFLIIGVAGVWAYVLTDIYRTVVRPLNRRKGP